MQISRDIGSMHIDISLDNRLWGSLGNSAEGKSYIASLLNTQNDICVVTWSDDLTEDMIISKLLKQEYLFVFLDRADMYYSRKINEVVKSLIKICPVFIDFKCWDNFYDIAPSFANVYFGEREVKIIETSDVRRC